MWKIKKIIIRKMIIFIILYLLENQLGIFMIHDDHILSKTFILLYFWTDFYEQIEKIIFIFVYIILFIIYGSIIIIDITKHLCK